MIKPILFNTEMVRAILDGNKTVTRRVIKNLPSCEFLSLEQNPYVCYGGNTEIDYMLEGLYAEFEANGDCLEYFIMRKAPCGPGDILWVRETWNGDWCDHYIYKADGGSAVAVGYAKEPHWHPSIHMPKEAARIFLRVNNVTVERLQSITPINCIREGVERTALEQVGSEFVRGMFSGIWDSTVKKQDLDRYSWNANPWVWVIEFERCEKPEGF